MLSRTVSFAVNECERLILEHIEKSDHLKVLRETRGYDSCSPMSEQEALSHALSMCDPTRTMAHQRGDHDDKTGRWLACIQWTTAIFGLTSTNELRLMNMDDKTKFKPK